jgi:hypothetical protein
MDRTGQQAIGFSLDHRITLTTQLFQLGSVQHCDLPAAVLDHAEILQFASRFGDAFTADAPKKTRVEPKRITVKVN